MEDGSKSLFRRAGPLVLARLVAAGITFVIPLVLARALALAEYGTYKQLFLVAQTLAVVLPFGVGQSLYFFIPRAERRRPFFGQTLVLLLAAGLLGGAAVIVLAPWVARHLANPALAQYRWPLALYVVGLIGAYPLELSFTSQGRTRVSALAYLISDGLRAAAMLVPVLLGGGLGGVMVAVAAWALVRLAATWWLMLRGERGPLWEPRLLRRQLSYALPFGAAMVLSLPPQYAHQFFVAAAVPPEAFALYAAGCFKLPLVDLLYSPTSEVLMVRLGELARAGRSGEAVQAFREAVSRLGYVFLPLAAFLLVAAPELLTALFGPRFVPAAPILRTGVVGILLAALPLDGVLRAQHHTRHIFASYLGKCVVALPLVWVGVRAFGLQGAIGAWALTEVVGKALLFWRVPAALSPPHRRCSALEVLPGRALARAALAAGVGAAAVLVLRTLASGYQAALPEGLARQLLPLAAAGLLFSAACLTTLQLSGVRVVERALALLRRGRPAVAT